MGLVYVIEDDANLREGLVQALLQLPGVQAYGFDRVQTAVDVLEGYPPDLILTELNLPERCGLDMLFELDERGQAPQVVLISAYLEAYREYIPQREGLVTLAKPFDLGVLLAHVQQVLTPPTAEPGAQSAFGLLEYLKVACLGEHTVEILVFAEGERNDLIGRVVVLGGLFWSAQDAQGMGADAFLRLACQGASRVSCNELQRTALMRNVYQSWEILIGRAIQLREGAAANPQFGLNPPEPALDFHPPGPFEPPRPLQCAPTMADTGGLAMQAAEPQVEVFSLDADPTLDDFLAAASAAESGGAPADAIQHLERAMAQYPGHPEILLWILRLRR